MSMINQNVAGVFNFDFSLMPYKLSLDSVSVDYDIIGYPTITMTFAATDHYARGLELLHDDLHFVSNLREASKTNAAVKKYLDELKTLLALINDNT